MKTVKLIVLAICLFTIGCKTEDLDQTITGSGKLIAEERVIANPNLKNIEINGDFVGSFSTRTDISKIFLIAEDNIIPYIETKETNNTISISEKDGFILSNKKDMIIDFKSTSLNSIVLNGIGKFRSDALHGTSPSVTVNGSGVIEISDIKDNSGNITVNGNGFVQLYGDVATINLTINGAGVIQINATTTTLNIRINGSGIIYYAGAPKLNTIIEGNGKVVRL